MIHLILIIDAFQLQSIIKNQTGIESWILEKANYRRSTTAEDFVHPYSKGWLFNVKQVLSWHCTAPGDGVYWPVVEGCDQYTLTVSIECSSLLTSFISFNN